MWILHWGTTNHCAPVGNDAECCEIKKESSRACLLNVQAAISAAIEYGRCNTVPFPLNVTFVAVYNFMFTCDIYKLAYSPEKRKQKDKE